MFRFRFVMLIAVSIAALPKAAHAGSQEFIRANVDGAKRSKTEATAQTIEAGADCNGYTTVESKDRMLVIVVQKATKPGTYGCAFYDFKSSAHAYQGIAGTCKATITRFGPVGSHIVGTVRGTLAQLDSPSFAGDFRVRRVGSGHCSGPTRPPLHAATVATDARARNRIR